MLSRAYILYIESHKEEVPHRTSSCLFHKTHFHATKSKLFSRIKAPKSTNTINIVVKYYFYRRKFCTTKLSYYICSRKQNREFKEAEFLRSGRPRKSFRTLEIFNDKRPPRASVSTTHNNLKIKSDCYAKKFNKSRTTINEHTLGKG